MKELINWVADPIRSFPIFSILFFIVMKYYRIVGTKKFAWIFTAIAIPAFLVHVRP